MAKKNMSITINEAILNNFLSIADERFINKSMLIEQMILKFNNHPDEMMLYLSKFESVDFKRLLEELEDAREKDYR